MPTSAVSAVAGGTSAAAVGAAELQPLGAPQLSYSHS